MNPAATATLPTPLHAVGTVPCSARSDSMAMGMVSDSATVATVGVVRWMARAHMRSDSTLSNRPFSRIQPMKSPRRCDRSSTPVACRMPTTGASSSVLKAPRKPKKATMDTEPSDGR